MRRTIHFLAFTIFLLILSSTSYGQGTSCDGVLKGLIDYHSKTIDVEFWERYKYAIDEKKLNSIENFKDHNKSIGVTLPIKKLPASFNFSSNGKAGYKGKTYNSFSELVERNQDFKKEFQEVFKTASEPVIDGWLLCMNQKRFRTWYTIKGNYLTLYLERGKFSEPKDLYIRSIDFPEEVLEFEGLDKSAIFDLLTWKSKNVIGQRIGGAAKPFTFKIKDKSVASYINIRTSSDDFSEGHLIDAVIPDIIITEKPCAPKQIVINASDFINSKSQGACNNCLGYGPGIITDSRPMVGERILIYEVYFECDATYSMEVQYASAVNRGMEISIDDKVVNSNCCNAKNGSGWYASSLKWEKQGEYNLKSGLRNIKFYSTKSLPHIRRIKFIPMN